MRAWAIGVAAVLTFASGALAEPAKQDSRKSVAEQKQPAPVELASADIGRPPVTRPAKPSEPVKRVVPRVTTCRCGDPQPGADTPER